MMRRLILGNRTRLATIAVLGFLPFLLSSCGGNDTAPARECTASGPGILALGCFGDGRSDHGAHSQSCQASEYSYYNVDLQLVTASSPFYVDNVTKLEIGGCTFKVTNEAGDVLEDRVLMDSSGIPVCRAGQPIQDNMGILDYSSCCRAGMQLTFGLVAEKYDSTTLLAQGTAIAICTPGQVGPTIDLVVEKI